MNQLKRRITLIPLTFYGVGTILGAGIYVIISEVAKETGTNFPLSFIAAAFIATFSGLSYSELSSRFPKSAGEAVYVNEAFQKPWLTLLVGYAVAITGIVSSATIIKGFYSYISLFITAPQFIITIVSLLVLMLIAIKGVKESVLFVTVITLIEILGLVIVLFVSAKNFSNIPIAVASRDFSILNSGFFKGTLLAFFAFVGFEDMVNMAEEVVEPEKNLPRSIIAALIISTALYFLVSLACSLSLTQSEITSTGAPLALILEKNSSLSPKILGVIGMIAIINGALVQIIMVSRLFYGMANLNKAPKFLGKISKRTNTPINSTILASALVLIFALTFPLDNLAKMTSTVIIILFCLINAALIQLKIKSSQVNDGFNLPLWVPICGLVVSLLFAGTNFII